MAEDIASPRRRFKKESPTGWWIAGILMRQSADKSKYWLNHQVFSAPDWRSAFEKATATGKSEMEGWNEAFSRPCAFIGITDLAPIHDSFEDGAGIFWEKFDILSVTDASPTYSIEELSKIYETE